MPTLDLSPEEQERVDAGLCACGCGEALPAGRTDWHGNQTIDHSRRTASTACRKRLARRREKEQRAIPMSERGRRKLIEEAEQALRLAADHEGAAVREHQAAARCRHAAARLFEQANETRQIVLSFVQIDRLRVDATGPGATWSAQAPVEFLPVRGRDTSPPAPRVAPVSQPHRPIADRPWSADQWRFTEPTRVDQLVPLRAGVHAIERLEATAPGLVLHLWADVPDDEDDRDQPWELRGIYVEPDPLSVERDGKLYPASGPEHAEVIELSIGPVDPKATPRRFPPLSSFGGGATGIKLGDTDRRVRLALRFRAPVAGLRAFAVFR